MGAVGEARFALGDPQGYDKGRHTKKSSVFFRTKEGLGLEIVRYACDAASAVGWVYPSLLGKFLRWV